GGVVEPRQQDLLCLLQLLLPRGGVADSLDEPAATPVERGIERLGAPGELADAAAEEPERPQRRQVDLDPTERRRLHPHHPAVDPGQEESTTVGRAPGGEMEWWPSRLTTRGRT